MSSLPVLASGFLATAGASSSSIFALFASLLSAIARELSERATVTCL